MKKQTEYEAELRTRARMQRADVLVQNLLTVNANIASGAAVRGGYLQQAMNEAIVFRQEVVARLSRKNKR